VPLRTRPGVATLSGAIEGDIVEVTAGVDARGEGPGSGGGRRPRRIRAKALTQVAVA